MTLQDDLTAIGFTEYEAKVYLALLREHPATGYQISKQAGVPRSMVYEALGRLDVRGAVLKTTEDKATLYRPLPPDALLNRYQQEHRRLMRSLRDGLQKRYVSRDEDRLWTVTGREPVVAYARQMIQHAASELMLVVADAALEALRSDLLTAHSRGVEVNALLTGEGQLEPATQIARHPPLESELHALTDSLIVVADGQEALIASGGQQTTATVTRNPNLVLIAHQFVWMELFAQRIFARLGPDLLARLDAADRRIFQGFAPLTPASDV